jgi:hypothetical protein
MNQISSGLRSLFEAMIKEIDCANEDEKLHKSYFNIFASERLDMVLVHLGCNPLAKIYARSVSGALGLRFLGDLVNKFKFPSNDSYKLRVDFIINNACPIVKKLCQRKYKTVNTCYRDGMLLSTNSLTKSINFTTKILKRRLFNGHTNTEPIRLFFKLKNIIHPKKREIEFFAIHDVILSGVKLFRMNLIPSSLCPMCDIDQDSKHIFEDCMNAKA